MHQSFFMTSVKFHRKFHIFPKSFLMWRSSFIQIRKTWNSWRRPREGTTAVRETFSPSGGEIIVFTVLHLHTVSSPLRMTISSTVTVMTHSWNFAGKMLPCPQWCLLTWRFKSLGELTSRFCRPIKWLDTPASVTLNNFLDIQKIFPKSQVKYFTDVKLSTGRSFRNLNPCFTI